MQDVLRVDLNERFDDLRSDLGCLLFVQSFVGQIAHLLAQCISGALFGDHVQLLIVHKHALQPHTAGVR